MAELATIARPYAEALFKASSADLSGAAVWLDELASIAANPQMQQFAGSPSVTSAQVLTVFMGVAEASKKMSLPSAAQNFLGAVIDNAQQVVARLFEALLADPAALPPRSGHRPAEAAPLPALPHLIPAWSGSS